jgi:hypothetical protein
MRGRMAEKSDVTLAEDGPRRKGEIVDATRALLSCALRADSLPATFSIALP